MRPIGFSTGALAFSDFLDGVRIVREHRLSVVELSALREWELEPLISSLETLDVGTFAYVSIHAPSRIEVGNERLVTSRLREVAKERCWPIVLHPDAIRDSSLWQGFGSLLCLENMDKRKPTGRSVEELSRWFEVFPEASFCLDLGHARQWDPTMTEAYFLLKSFGTRLKQIHVSDVGSSSKHAGLSWGSITAYQKVASMIPEPIPIILESMVAEREVSAECSRAAQALRRTHTESQSDSLSAR